MGRFFSSPLGRMLLLSIVLYALSSLLGYEASRVQINDESSRRAIQGLAQLLAPMASLQPPLMMLAIFLNNSIKALAVIGLGFTLGIVPFIFLAVNGIITGLVVGEIGEIAGPGLVVAALAPHGVIEIPALLLASALGFMVSRSVVLRVLGRETRPGKEFKRAMALYLKVVLPALLVASAIEAFVTPMLIRR